MMEGLKIKELVIEIMNADILKTVCTSYDVFVNFSVYAMTLGIRVYLGNKRIFEAVEL
ncbi:MAG: hypothetical protein E6176_09875 [Clostridium celatum]|nr:hypothetical protein [Clostridium celatum]